MATRKPRLMLTKTYKSHAAASKAAQSWADKLGVSVGARGPTPKRKAVKRKASSKRAGVRKNARRPRTKTGQFKRLGRKRR